jgi:hypothetical protein
MGALTASVSAVGGGEAGLLGIVGIAVALLGGVLSLWRERVEWRRAKGAAALLASDDISDRGASFLRTLSREEGESEGEGEDGEAVGVQRRAHAKAFPPPLPLPPSLPPLPFRPSPQPQQPLTIENVRAAVREELVIVRNDIKNASKWTFWTGVGQGFILYVLGIAATLIISG